MALIKKVSMAEALDTVRLCKDDQESTFAMLASVLWLGNISVQVIDNENHVLVRFVNILSVYGRNESRKEVGKLIVRLCFCFNVNCDLDWRLCFFLCKLRFGLVVLFFYFN
ncbi:hypothetical protein IFM89_015335 [Coptis chinensis]|uniref:Uncharacterized protein n=1 Tax=Coptis chinensis TaxID=261450 RepID=A0A835ISP9_9MAGN|nr:hypothetical protein IFM89_015335 [Coptis chinensis]